MKENEDEEREEKGGLAHTVALAQLMANSNDPDSKTNRVARRMSSRQKEMKENEDEEREEKGGLAHTVALAQLMANSNDPDSKTNRVARRMSSRRLKSRVLLSQYLDKIDLNVGTRLLSAFEREDADWRGNQGYRSQKAIASRKLVRKRTMFRAAALGHGDILLVLLRQGHCDPNWADPATGQTPLIQAAMHGHLDCAIALLSARALVDRADRWGFTALHYAAKYNRAPICAHLIKRGADKNAKNHLSGRTPLELSCEWGVASPREKYYSKTNAKSATASLAQYGRARKSLCPHGPWRRLNST